jgi:hypothetical protein
VHRDGKLARYGDGPRLKPIRSLSGAAGNRPPRFTAAVTQAVTTGMKLRGFHS